MKKKLCLLLCLLLILFCFSSCSFSPSDTISSRPELEPELEPVTITWLWEAENNTQLPSDSFAVKQILDTLNIQYVHISAANNNFYSTLQSLIASGQMPDIIQSEPAQTKKMKQYELIIPVEQYLNEEYLGNVIHISNRWEEAVAASVDSSGQIWAIPSTYGSNSTPLPWIRYDWLEQLELPVPETFSQLAEVLTCFTVQDPDQNGLDDTTGALLRGSELSLFAFNFGCALDRWYPDPKGSGGFELGLYQSRCKNYIRYMQQLVKSGACGSELATISEDQIVQQIRLGKTGFVLISPDAASPKSIDPNADWRPIPVLREIYDRGYLPSYPILKEEYVISSKCSNVTAALKLMNMMAEDFSSFEKMDYTGFYWPLSYGIQKLNWDVTEDGKFDFIGVYFPYLKKVNANIPYLGVCKRWENQFEEAARQAENRNAGFSEPIEPITYFYEEQISENHIAKPANLNGVLFPMSVSGFCGQALEKWPDFFYGIVLGEEDLEQQWQYWLEDAASNGYAEMKVIAKNALYE